MTDSLRRKEIADAVRLKYQVKLYSLFKKVSTGKGFKYERVSECSYSEKLACRVFMNRLSTDPLNYSIRPVEIICKEAR